MEALLENLPMILAVLLGLSEALGHIPQVKANSVFQLISGLVSKAAKLFSKKEEKKELEPSKEEKEEEEEKPSAE